MDTPSSPRGTKRPAPSEPAIRPIKRLDKKVVDKIAAGEIIQRPSNALKELIENSIDAGSTQIDILVREGGLKLLQITDNGHGIRREDLPILCERFTTSKISKFEDLEKIMSYGFRGEALASISYISHLTVTTKTADDTTAWRAQYSEGALIPGKSGTSADPRPTAGKVGSQITAEDLFYNTPARLKAFRNVNEEHNRILDIVSRYAIHSAGIGYSCKKHGDISAGVTTQAKASIQDNIRTIHGSAVANELLQVTVPKDRVLGFEAAGFVTNANYHTKKTTFLLFINNRSVESTSLKRALEQVYTTFLPKGGHPFIYLSVLIEPHRVDVNIHPTKREVGFLNEEEIIEKLCTAISKRLGEGDTSRRFTVQTLLPGAKPIETIVPEGSQRKGSTASNYLVRTDPQTRKITSMFTTQTIAGQTHAQEEREGQGLEAAGYELIERERQSIKLASIRQLRDEVMDVAHNELTEVFANHTYVGLVDGWRRLVAIQHSVKLYLVDYGAVCYEFFYQLGLSEFGNFGTIEFAEPLNIRDLLAIAMEVDEETTPEAKSQEMETTMDILIQRREMILEYFNITISLKGELSTLPLLLRQYTPNYGKLPTFLRRLGQNVDWFTEKPCFESVLKELALFYTPEPTPPKLGEQEEGDGGRREYVLKAVEEVLFPELKRRFIAVKSLVSQKRVVEVADLPGLYRIFERC